MQQFAAVEAPPSPRKQQQASEKALGWLRGGGTHTQAIGAHVDMIDIEDITYRSRQWIAYLDHEPGHRQRRQPLRAAASRSNSYQRRERCGPVVCEFEPLAVE